MKLIANTTDDNFDYIWITDHYDWHLQGICVFKNNLCKFEYDWSKDDLKFNNYYNIFSLNNFEKIKYLLDKSMFEILVNTDWSYDINKRYANFLNKYRPKFTSSIYFKIKSFLNSYSFLLGGLGK